MGDVEKGCPCDRIKLDPEASQLISRCRSRLFQTRVLLLSAFCFVFPISVVVWGFRTTSTPTKTDKSKLPKTVANATKGLVGHLYINARQIAEVETKKEDSNLVEKLADRALQVRSFYHTEVGNTTLGKPRRHDSDAKAGAKDGRVKIGNDAIGANPKTVGMAAAAASAIEATVLLPINSVQTRMQASGLGFTATLRTIFEGGTFNGLQQLYKALPPTMAMLGMRQGLTFGSGAAIKKQLPSSWSETLRDATSMGTSAAICTTLIFPMDTIKTRLQLGRSLPRLSQLYMGFAPAVNYAILGQAMWMATRNALERNVPDPENSVLEYWKHFVCGGLSGTAVTCAIFPLDTLKKRLQASDGSKLLHEASALFKEGGFQRFYRGIEMKLATSAAHGALFNVLFVACSRSLEALGQVK